jgi:nucleoside-diphosphate-sugar epimerase
VRVAIVGAHGQIARLLARRLLARGDSVVGLIRNPDHQSALHDDGVEPVVCDVELASVEDVVSALRECDAAVFAAGAGPGSGAERKLTMDRDGAVKLLQAAADAGVTRYVIVSAVGAEDPPAGEEVFAVYLRAKAEADQAVMASDLDWTVVRPGGLTDDPGSGRVAIRANAFRGQVPRDDVAAVLELVLHEPRSAGKLLYVGGGDDPVEDALRQAL